MKKFILNKHNFSLLLFYFLLAGISVVSIFLAELNNGLTPILFVKQILFYIISFVVIYYMQKIDIFTYEKLSILFFLISIGALVLLLIVPESLAPTINGARGWFNFKFFTVQPSEFAKVATVGLLSYLIIQNHFKNSSDFIKLVGVAVITIIPFVLIMKENDLGNGLFFVFIFLAIAFLVSSRSKTFLSIYLITISFIGSIVALAIYFPTVLEKIGLKQYQLKRILSWLNPNEYIYDYSYQISNAIAEVKSGGLTGSFSKNNVYIDEQFNDFIITIIAKNFGFIGVTIFIIVYLLFLLKIINIANKCQQGNYSYYFILLTVLSFAFSFIINSYSSTGLIPVIGINMPFISYGGSSLLANTILLGIVVKINSTIHEEQEEDNYSYEYNDDEYID